MIAVLERDFRWPETIQTPRSEAQTSERPRLGNISMIGMLLPVRIFLAAGWLRAGAEKVIDPAWWHGAVLRGFLAKQHSAAIPFFRPVMERLIAPAAIVVALTVMVTQLLCGVMIASGKKMKLALRWAFLMNVTFILAGRVTPSAFYLVLELVLLFAIADGVLSTTPTVPSRSTFAAAGISVLLAAIFVPYIRTIQPAEVIEDPAMMLMFIGLVTAATLVVRHAAHPLHGETRLGRLWSGRLAGWAHAKPRRLGSERTDR
jgi:thiosulfate dehydrogenase [quinone] large subunit